MDFVPYNAILNLTDSCNLACKYCFVQQQSHFMSLDTAKQVVDFLYNNLIKVRQMINNDELISTLSFFGGEPMLCFDSVIKPLVEYIEEKYPHCFSYLVTTNGTLLTDENCSFMKKHKFDGVLLSFDGIKEAQDFFRPAKNGTSSYDDFMERIEHYKKYFKDISIRSTIVEANADYLYENYKFFSKLDLTDWLLGIDQFNIISYTLFETLFSQFGLIYEDIYASFNNRVIPLVPDIIEKSISSYFISRLNTYLDIPPEKIIKKPNLKYNCGFNLKEICINYLGDIYPCQDVCTFDNANLYVMGNIKDGIDYDKLDKLQNDIDKVENYFIKKQLPDCSPECKIVNNYRLSCPVTTCPAKVLEDGFILVDQCVLFKYLLDRSRDLVIQLANEQNETFLNYLSKKYYYYNFLKDLLSQPDEKTQQLYIKQYMDQEGFN